MKDYFVKTPAILKWLFRNQVWSLPDKNAIYLTFDDGPVPEVTPWVLETLEEYNAKATFFCIGSNIEKYPHIFKQIIAADHGIGNHTYHHVDGWKTEHSKYLNDIDKCHNTIEEILGNSYNKKLFRPPYGHIRPRQTNAVIDRGYTVIMWDVLSADFDTEISAKKSLQNVLKNIKAGSIVVFHDSLKAKDRLQHVLPKVLDFAKERRWDCKSIEPEVKRIL